MSGLMNIGNTCYMNSILQSLIHTKDLTLFLITGEYKKDINNSKKETELLKEYINILNEYVKGSVIRPINFKKTINMLNVNFNNRNEQDCHEFLVYLIDTLHISVSYSVSITYKGIAKTQNEKYAVSAIKNWQDSFKKEYSSIISMFYGQYHSQLSCNNENCKYISDKFEPFCYLPLSIRDDSENLYELLNNFTKPEILENENNWKCSKCKNNIKSKKSIYIWKSPKILIIQLKRFDVFGNKITNHINCPLSIDVEKYISHYNNINTSYELYSISNHQGNLNGGHYYSYCKNKRNEWLCFDDSNITRVDVNDLITPSAYLLFYKLV
jgi:ubiquitin carboxyl-terminal hydrolase 8